MTNTTRNANGISPYDMIQIGMHIQTEDGTIHQITDIRIRRSPKRGLLRMANIFSDATRTWIRLMEVDWRIVSPLAAVIRGSHNSIDGLHHSHSCTGIVTTVLLTSDGWSKSCRKCGFSVFGYDTREQAEDAYLADQVGAFR